MQIADLLTPERVRICEQASSKKKLLEKISEILSQDSECSARQIYESLYQREKLGNTSLGNGIAIPHGKLPDCDAAMSGVFLLLKEPLDFDSVDGEPVDTVFALVMPEDAGEENLSLLGDIANELFTSEDFLKAIHAAPDAAHIYDLLSNWSADESQTA